MSNVNKNRILVNEIVLKIWSKIVQEAGSTHFH